VPQQLWACPWACTPSSPGQGWAAVRLPGLLLLLLLRCRQPAGPAHAAVGRGGAAAEHVHQGGTKGPDVRLWANQSPNCELLQGHYSASQEAEAADCIERQM
jgi:hypothetical protein